MEFSVADIVHDEDYPLLKSWWDKRNFPAAEQKFLPPTGVKILFEGKPVCGGFLFRTDANVAIMGNLVSDPDSPGKVRHEAMNILIEALTYKADTFYMGMLCCSTNLPGLMTRFEDNGFTKTDESVSTFGRILCQ